MTTVSLKKQVLILGGGYAGLLAAYRLRRQTNPNAVEITLVNGLDHFVERIRLHQIAAQQSFKPYYFQDLFKGCNIIFKRGWVTALAPEEQTISMKTSTGTEMLNYDYLIYALGSTVASDILPGCLEYAHTLATEETTLHFQKKVTELAAQDGHLLVCGGGLTGIETVTELAEGYPHLNITLVTQGALGETLSEEGQAHLYQVFAELGITLIEHVPVNAIEANAALCSDGRTIPFDLCLWAGPFKVPALAGEAGIQVNHRGQMVVDAHLRSRSHPTIYGVGDAASPGQAIKVPIRMSCATATQMGLYGGQHLAATLNGNPEGKRFNFAYLFQCISLGRREALVQWVKKDDTPKPKLTTGWLGRHIKENICRYTVFLIKGERGFTYLKQRVRGRKVEKWHLTPQQLGR